MASEEGRTWLLLIHQLPPRPNALRVKIWRRLRQVGAVAVKQSVYAMPLSGQGREDLGWILQEVVAGGGEGSLSEARFVAGLDDGQIIAQFHVERNADYEKILQDCEDLKMEWSSDSIDPRDPEHKGPARLARLRRRLEEVRAIDFFQAPARAATEDRLRELAGMLAAPPAPVRGAGAPVGLRGKVWVTRQDVFIDRLACGWLVRRFVDAAATFKFVAAEAYATGANEIAFDMFEGDFSHEGELCTFEVMIRRLGLDDPALIPLAEIVHDLDLKDNQYGHAETAGLHALLSGLTTALADDDTRMAEGVRLFDNIYAFFQGQRAA